MFNSDASARIIRGALVAVFALCGASLALAQESLPDVLAARVSTTPERARLIVDLSAMTEFALASLAEPDRIVVDVRAAAVPTIAPQAVAGEGIVARFTTTRVEEGRVRVELALTAPAVVQQAYLLDAVDDQPARLVVDLVPTSREDFAARAAADLANSLGRAPSEAGSSASGPASAPSPAEPSSASSEPPSAPEPVGEAPAAPVAIQSRPLIVLDPGHGGVDNGASSPKGIHEKDITLAFALQLRDRLVASGRFDVALTREDDTYLTLNDRVTLARQNRADLFISLHADTFQQEDIRGASIYTRDERATDILDKVLADGENRADVVAGYIAPDTRAEVVNILVDLMRREVRQQAYVAANDIVKAMEPSVTLRRFPVRQADFFVLQAPDIPSLLIELGFMSNAADISNLESAEWRDRMVAAIGIGVEDYFAALAAAR